MNRREAIAAIDAVQSGGGVDLDLPLELMGEIAIDKRRDPAFMLGVEYGYIVGLMRAFDITPADLTPMP